MSAGAFILQNEYEKTAVTRIRTGVAAATTQSTNHYTITARHSLLPVSSYHGEVKIEMDWSKIFNTFPTANKDVLPLYTLTKESVEPARSRT